MIERQFPRIGVPGTVVKLEPACESLTSGADCTCLGQAPLEVDPVAYRKGRGTGFCAIAACDSARADAYLGCSRLALWEVDPVASPLVGEPGSALYGRSSTTRSTTCSTSGIHRLPAPKLHATASATHRIGSLCPCLWSNVNAGSGRRFRTIVRWSSRSS